MPNSHISGFQYNHNSLVHAVVKAPMSILISLHWFKTLDIFITNYFLLLS